MDIMRSGIIQKRVGALIDGSQNVHDEERSGWLSVTTEDLVQKLTKK